MRSVVLLLYNLLLPLGLLAGLPGFLIKGKRRGGLRRNFGQRLGRYREETVEAFAEGGAVWVHAVSVGEVLVALRLIAELQRLRPQQPIVLSTTTTTGYRLAEKDAPAGVPVIYHPIDLHWIVSRSVKAIRPAALVLVEAEVWPNLVNAMRRRRTPVLMVNARLSDRSEARFRRFRSLTAPIFSMLHGAGVCFEDDVSRIAGLGIPEERVTLTGNLKFDQDEGELPREMLARLRRVLAGAGFGDGDPILLAGSTHPGEEALIGEAYQLLRESHPGLRYLVVPRHVERREQVQADLERLEMRVQRRSSVIESASAPEALGRTDGAKPPRSSGEPPDALLIDTTGELRAWYHLADVVIIGKSLLAKGGQNPVEPLQAGRPVIAGPHMENFRAIVRDLDQHGGILRVEDQEEMVAAVRGLLDYPEQARKVAEAGRRTLAQHRGAAARTAELVYSSIEREEASQAG